MSDEGELISEFARSRSERAFAAIVKLHLNLVYATALRQAGDRGMAEEITQNVFMALAERSVALRWDATLAGWLYRTTLNQSRARLRAELRRRKREQVAAELAAASRAGESPAASVLPLLDEALVSLRDRDRVAVLLHFMEGRPFREVGALLGVGEDAARKRVKGALEELAGWFQKRGFNTPSSTIVAVLSLNLPESASAEMASSIVAACGSGAAAGTGAVATTFTGALAIMTAAQFKFAVAGTLLAIGLATFTLHQRERTRSNVAAAAKPQAAAPDSANAPAVSQAASVSFNPPPASPKSFYERVNEGDMTLTMLEPWQAEEFIAQNKTNAQSLLAGFRVTHDIGYLKRAATNFPTDPAVLLRVAAHDAFPEARREWLERFKLADPDNALPLYLSAKDHFDNNDIQAALSDLQEASQKPALRDYLTDQIQTLEEIYLAAGHSTAEAKVLGMSALEMPHVAQLVQTSDRVLGLMKQYQAAGDAASAESMARTGLQLAANLNGVQEGGNLLGEMVSVVVEQRFLNQLDASSSYDFLNGTVESRRAALQTQEAAIREDAQFSSNWLARAPEVEIVSYFDRLKLYGEAAALAWLKNRSL